MAAGVAEVRVDFFAEVVSGADVFARWGAVVAAELCSAGQPGAAVPTQDFAWAGGTLVSAEMG